MKDLGLPELKNKIFLAPMAEVTDSSFRTIAKENGAEITFTQMISAKGVIENNFDTLKYLAFGKNEKPIGVQLLGNDPALVRSAVREITRYKPDIIDLNCACPQSAVTRHNLGACLIDDPGTLGKLIKAMKDAAGDIPVSAKMRLGADAKRINIADNAKAAEDNGASLIFVHARTRSDRYYVDARWEWLAKVKQSVSIPVIGNGSLFTPEDILKMKNETGVDSVLIARGALGNPFLFDRYRELAETGEDPGHPGMEKVKDTALRHIKLLIGEYGPVNALNYAKKNILWYFRFFNGIEELMNNLFRVRDAAKLPEIVEEHYQKFKDIQSPVPEVLEDIESRFREKVLFWLARPVNTE